MPASEQSIDGGIQWNALGGHRAGIKLPQNRLGAVSLDAWRSCSSCMKHMYDARIFDNVSENAAFGPVHQLNLGKGSFWKCHIRPLRCLRKPHLKSIKYFSDPFFHALIIEFPTLLPNSQQKGKHNAETFTHHPRSPHHPSTCP